jgi:hypothetical protein
MERRTLIGTAAVAALGAVAGMVALTVAGPVVERLRAERGEADLNAQVLAATPAREIVVMHADAKVIGSAEKKELLNRTSELHYVSRAKFTYSVDMRGVGRSAFAYDPATDVLRVELPKIKIQSNVYGPRKRIASLAFLATEGGSGNELEREAAAALARNAMAEAQRPEMVQAATTAAKYEVSQLYEDALRAVGKKTRVVVSGGSGPPPPSPL